MSEGKKTTQKDLHEEDDGQAVFAIRFPGDFRATVEEVARAKEKGCLEQPVHGPKCEDVSAM